MHPTHWLISTQVDTLKDEHFLRQFIGKLGIRGVIFIAIQEQREFIKHVLEREDLGRLR